MLSYICYLTMFEIKGKLGVFRKSVELLLNADKGVTDRFSRFIWNTSNNRCVAIRDFLINCVVP